MQENRHADHKEEEDITLKQVILTTQEFYEEVLRNWKWIILFTIPFIAFMLYNAISTPAIYPATLTFMVNEDDGNSMGGISAILGQFGIGGARKGKNNLDKILELASSRKIISSVIFEKRKVDGKEDYIANHLIFLYEFHDKWDEDTTGLDGFLFIHDSIAIFNKTENKALKSVYRKIVGNEKKPGILTTSYDEETGIMSIGVSAQSEYCSIELSKLVYEKLSDFYIEKTTEKQNETFKVVQFKADSIKQLLNVKEYALANFKDSNRGLWATKTKLKELQLQRDVQVLNVMYGESLKNLEIADFSLRNRTPFVQIIDEPIAPITPSVKSKLSAIFIGGILGVFLSVSYFVFWKIFRDTMNAE